MHLCLLCFAAAPSSCHAAVAMLLQLAMLLLQLARAAAAPGSCYAAVAVLLKQAMLLLLLGMLLLQLATAMLLCMT